MTSYDDELDERASLAEDDDDLDEILDNEDAVELSFDEDLFDEDQDPEAARYGGGLMDALWRGEV